VQLEPGGGLKAFRQGGAGLFVSGSRTETGDQFVFIDDEELDAIAIEEFHR
jgi:hypothetical protein